MSICTPTGSVEANQVHIACEDCTAEACGCACTRPEGCDGGHCEACGECWELGAINFRGLCPFCARRIWGDEGRQ